MNKLSLYFLDRLLSSNLLILFNLGTTYICSKNMSFTFWWLKQFNFLTMLPDGISRILHIIYSVGGRVGFSIFSKSLAHVGNYI